MNTHEYFVTNINTSFIVLVKLSQIMADHFAGVDSGFAQLWPTSTKDQHKHKKAK
jgi:hypothetical protein